MFDLDKRVYRLRGLTREPLAPGALRFASEQEAKADRFLAADIRFSRRSQRPKSVNVSVTMAGMPPVARWSKKPRAAGQTAGRSYCILSATSRNGVKST
ncbi:hypothetical protein [Methylobacterium fujisawaense]|uniref:hypothetical protein n=1 Tax=Methylobacterium fujisawaense TaxID=107400 RepID=UPI002F3526D5